MLANALHQLHLLLWCQTCDCSLDHSSKRDFVHSDEAVVIHIREETHDELTVHTICNTSMSRNRITEVLNLKGSFEAGSEKASEGSDQRSKCSEDQDVHLHWCHGEGFCEREPDWETIDVGYEDRVGGALETGPDVCSEILVLLAFP
jgi:hypothetical protein